MILVVCKECFEKKYGEGMVGGLFYSESEYEGTCIICSKKKRMVEEKRPNPKNGWLIFD